MKYPVLSIPFALVAATFLLVFHELRGQEMPEGFQLETVSENIEYPAGMVHYEEGGISYVWELSGKIWVMEGDDVADSPLLDISDQVGRWNDHGLMSMALDPNFSENGRFYLLYVLDRHYLMNEGTSAYDPNVNDYEEATIGRLVRYAVDPANPTELSDEEKVILIGETAETGIPIMTISHALGTVLFGSDGSLLLTVGDSNAPGSDYNGEGEVPALGYDDQGLADGILHPDENVGAFRSQYLNSYCGKVLRIDPETGMGLPSNPFYDENEPDAPRSKVWALGFRNPFRMTLIPETGSQNPSDGQPGHLVIGDVGDWSWEEINVCTDPGQNFGWPLFQGPVSYYLFNHPEDLTPNIDYPLPGGCGQDYFYFQDLIVQPRENHDEVWTHPCGGTISDDNIEVFVHQPPAIAYKNYLDPPEETVVPVFDGNGDASHLSVTHPDLNIEGAEDFGGISSVAGTFMVGEQYPTEYQGVYVQADFSGWFRAFHFDENGNVQKIEHWHDDIGNIVHISQNPIDGQIYLCGLFPGEIKRISFAGNLKPVIQVTPDTAYGPGPLVVQFDASESYDPEETPLTFNWDFGDGNIASGPMPEHTFSNSGSEPEAFEVSLTVEDADGKSAEKTLLVSINNTPPTAEISSFNGDYLYPISTVTLLDLEGDISDEESPLDELGVEWKVYLHHNTHFHLEATYNSLEEQATILPLGCGYETFWYRIDLTVTDPQGLQAYNSVEIFPNCGDNTAQNPPLAEKFTVYPNPAFANCYLRFANDPGEWMRIKFYSDTGKLIRSEERSLASGQTEALIIVSDLPPGFYILECETALWKETRKLAVVRK